MCFYFRKLLEIYHTDRAKQTSKHVEHGCQERQQGPGQTPNTRPMICPAQPERDAVGQFLARLECL